MVEKLKDNTAAPVTYRPVCLINSYGKLFEKVISQRLVKVLENEEGLYDSQYGFRKGRKTVDARKSVKDVSTYINRGAYSRKGFCALITLDIRNGINSAPLKGIVKTLKK